MSLLILSVIVQIGLLLRVVRTGRPMYSIFIIPLALVSGSLAYVIVELLPELSRSGQGRTGTASLSWRKMVLGVCLQQSAANDEQ